MSKIKGNVFIIFHLSPKPYTQDTNYKAKTATDALVPYLQLVEDLGVILVAALRLDPSLVQQSQQLQPLVHHSFAGRDHKHLCLGCPHLTNKQTKQAVT